MITYNPKQVSASFAGFPIEDFGEDTFISVTPNSDIFNYVKGIDGKTAYFKSLDFDATVEITLLQNSVTDLSLRTVFIQSQNDSASSNLIASPLSIVDNNTGLFLTTNSARIVTNADCIFGKGHEGRRWTFYCENMNAKINPVNQPRLSSNLLRTAQGFTDNIQQLPSNIATFFG